MYTVESLQHLQILNDTAVRLGMKITVLIRVTSGNQFGVDEADIRKIISDRTDYPGVEIEGLQFYSGTQKKDLSQMKTELEHLEMCIRDRYGILMKKINGKYYGFDVSGHTVKGIRVGSVSMYEIPKLYYFNPKTGAVDKKKTSLYRKYAATSTLAKQNNASKIKKILGKYKKCTISKGNTCMLDGNGKDVTCLLYTSRCV